MTTFLHKFDTYLQLLNEDFALISDMQYTLQYLMDAVESVRQDMGICWCDAAGGVEFQQVNTMSKTTFVNPKRQNMYQKHSRGSLGDGCFMRL